MCKEAIMMTNVANMEMEMALVNFDRQLINYKRIREMETEEKEIVSPWIGTIIKDDEESVSTPAVYKSKRKYNRRFPCSNHTYKDLRFLGDSENRKCMKTLCEKRARREFLAREARLTLAAFEEYQDYVEDWR